MMVFVSRPVLPLRGRGADVAAWNRNRAGMLESPGEQTAQRAHRLALACRRPLPGSWGGQHAGVRAGAGSHGDVP